MSVIDDYWRGVMTALRADVDELATLIKHAGEKGRANEYVLNRILTDALPAKYGIGTGLLIDTKNGYSRQTDIVLFDKESQPQLFSRVSSLLHPIETVYACIEVKTTLRSADLDDIARKIRRMRQMHLEEEDVAWSEVVDHESRTALRLRKVRLTHPLYHVFCYSTRLSLGSLRTKLRKLDPDSQPDRIVVLKPGYEGCKAEPGSNKAFTLGLVNLQQRDSGDSPIGSKKMDVVFGVGESAKDGVDYNGRKYPVARVGQNMIAGEPERALALYLRNLTVALFHKRLSPRPIIDRYLLSPRRQTYTPEKL